MDGYTYFVICLAVVWANMSLAKIASELDRIERHSKRSADAIELMASIANIKRGG